MHGQIIAHRMVGGLGRQPVFAGQAVLAIGVGLDQAGIDSKPLAADIPLQTEPADPAIGQVEMDLVAKPALGADAEAVADDKHADHQLGIDRKLAGVAEERAQTRSNAGQIDKAIDGAQHTMGRDVPFPGGLLEQYLLRNRLLAHYRTALRSDD